MTTFTFQDTKDLANKPHEFQTFPAVHVDSALKSLLRAREMAFGRSNPDRTNIVATAKTDASGRWLCVETGVRYSVNIKSIARAVGRPVRQDCERGMERPFGSKVGGWV